MAVLHDILSPFVCCTKPVHLWVPDSDNGSLHVETVNHVRWLRLPSKTCAFGLGWPS